MKDIQPEPLPDLILADCVTLTVRDKSSGIEYVRVLPIDYSESAFGISLKGEDMNAKPVTMVFLSDLARQKIADVTGSGADSPREHGH